MATSTATKPAAKRAPAKKTTAAVATTPPLIGEYWRGQGGIYIGVAAADGDLPQGHLILCEATSSKRFVWADAVAWAKKQTADGHTDMRLPTRFEAALIYANGRKHVDVGPWYWTGTEYDASYAWNCFFDGGTQDYNHKGLTGAARAVRRVTF